MQNTKFQMCRGSAIFMKSNVDSLSARRMEDIYPVLYLGMIRQSFPQPRATRWNIYIYIYISVVILLASFSQILLPFFYCFTVFLPPPKTATEASFQLFSCSNLTTNLSALKINEQWPDHTGQKSHPQSLQQPVWEAKLQPQQQLAQNSQDLVNAKFPCICPHF